MFDCIFDERLQYQGRNRSEFEGLLHIKFDRQPISETNLFNIKKRLQEVDLFSQGTERPIGVGQHVTEHAAKPHSNSLCLVGFRSNQRSNSIQRIEKKVRVDLGTERSQFCLDQLLAQTTLKANP